MTALLSDITSAKELLHSLNTFEKYSGLRVNVSKTKAMWIGVMKNPAEKPLSLEWCLTVINLGVFVPAIRKWCLRKIFRKS